MSREGSEAVSDRAPADTAVAEFERVMAAAADGDLSGRVDVDTDDDRLDRIARAYNEMAGELASTLRTVHSFSGDVSEMSQAVESDSNLVEASSHRVSSQMGEISSLTDRQNDELQRISHEMSDLSASGEEMAAATAEVAQEAQEATERGEAGKEAAERALEEIRQVESTSGDVADRIADLEAQIREIDDIIEFITDIADQTNLLALNANIEAARAGEAGDGFQVVAGEVKELAGEAKEAAKEIEEMVTEAQSRTRNTVSEVETATESIKDSARTAENALTALSDTVEHIEEANQGIQEISSTVDAQAEANERVVDQVTEVAELGQEVDEQAADVSVVTQTQVNDVGEISRRASRLRSDLAGLEESLTPFTINDWHRRIVGHCREAGIDWRQFEGTTLTIGTSEHPFTSTTESLLSSFEELTGIDIEYVTLPESRLFEQLEADMDSGRGRFDAFYLGLWPCASYHQRGWVRDLQPFLDDASLTDKRWFQLDDFPASAFEAFTYGDDDLVAMPFGVEPYGCVAYDEPTFRLLGLEEPTDFESLRHCAKVVHESDEIDRDGICSRASTDALSTPNWVTMFNSHGAEWIDRTGRTAAVDSPEAIQSLRTYAELLGDYGPADVGTFDWVASNGRYFQDGDVGMVYHGPASVMETGGEQYNRTKWVPPLAGPDGDRSAGIYAWGLGISQYSETPGAAWLYLQWATCRQMDLVTSTRQWAGQDEYIPARGHWTLDQSEYATRGHVQSWIDAFTEGIDLVPADVPPVPLDTPRNMQIMSEAATAMNAAVTGEKSPERALKDISPTITDHVKQIPDEYLRRV